MSKKIEFHDFIPFRSGGQLGADLMRIATRSSKFNRARFKAPARLPFRVIKFGLEKLS
jgi:hypothetical protein